MILSENHLANHLALNSSLPHKRRLYNSYGSYSWVEVQVDTSSTFVG